jgi:hypothetical protein
MQTTVVTQPQQLDYFGEIKNLFARIEKYPKLFNSPKGTEFEFCALLAAWESTALHDTQSSRWRELWSRHCVERHHRKSGLTLADPVEGPTLSERWHISSEETAKAYKTVRDGMRRVFKATLAKHHLEAADRSAVPAQPAAILRQLIDHSLKTAHSFASPEGLESFLLTLMGLFERSLGQDHRKLASREQWHVELRRKRFVGPPETRTLADVAPLNERLTRQAAFPHDERIRILEQMLPTMKQVTKELQHYIAEHD